MYNRPMNFVTEAAIAYVMMNENLLLEDKLDYLKTNKKISGEHDAEHAGLSSDELYDKLHSTVEPDKTGKNLDYISSLYSKAKAFKLGDTGATTRLKNAIDAHNKNSRYMPAEQRQLTLKKFPNVEVIEAAVKQHSPEEKKQAMRDSLDQPGHRLMYTHTDGTKVYRIPGMREGEEAGGQKVAEKIYGNDGPTTPAKGAPHPAYWCIARTTSVGETPSHIDAEGNNHFYKYLHKEGGKAYYAIHSKGKVFMMHTQSGQLHDSDNNPVSDEDFAHIEPTVQHLMDHYPEVTDHTIYH